MVSRILATSEDRPWRTSIRHTYLGCSCERHGKGLFNIKPEPASPDWTHRLCRTVRRTHANNVDHRKAGTGPSHTQALCCGIQIHSAASVNVASALLPCFGTGADLAEVLLVVFAGICGHRQPAFCGAAPQNDHVLVYLQVSVCHHES